MATCAPIEVAVGVVLERSTTEGARRVLLARRPEHSHQGGKWEFPGGKREPSESIVEALGRELKEELDITVLACEPLIRVRHEYPEKTVLLDVWTVTRFKGTPHGREGQPVLWKAVAELDPVDFPPANRAIIQALRLPDRCLITPDAYDYRFGEFIDQVETVLRTGVRLLQFRSHAMPRPDYFKLAREVSAVAADYRADCILNAPFAWWPDLIKEGIPLSGFHLTSGTLREVDRLPEGMGMISAACHTGADIKLANRLGLDFVYLSPVKPTASHAGAGVLGWDNFKALVEQAAMPVYALGGLTPADIPDARRAGAQGIAAIRGLWPKNI
ncbi:MAG TPA: Nudix family hydrolase [Gammaproteobacteria bacterium]|jgi:8-oxo-dGTP diphosphatase